ncbi:Homeobox protein YOX1 [Candida viswanathii]|uniref:Homeobox protein YOX1 n=1 Tax=Candida viswanathii TaxID=5486 RepID=A0A367YJ09_9ASCO|nr:Homeobox protein YOX1 [Candida viswanathii]
MMHLQTPIKRSPLLPTPSTTKTTTTLPPLSTIMQTAHSSHYKDHPLSASTPYKSALPPIDTLQSLLNYVPTPPESLHHKRSYDDAIADTSILELRKASKSNSSSSSSLVSIGSDKAYAFISHSPSTFPLQEPSIDNAPLARRKRRRTSPHELNILNKEFALGTTPNKSRRLEIAAKVSMTEKAVQIWFQNKRQSIRKQLNLEKEITVLPPTPVHQQAPASLPAVAAPVQPQQPQPPVLTHTLSTPLIISSTPTKPLINKSLSFMESSTPLKPTPLPQPRSYLIPVFKNMSTPLPSKINTLPSTATTSPATLPATYDESNVSIDDSMMKNTLVQTNKKQPQSLNGENTSTMTFKLMPSKITQKLETESRKPLGDVTNVTLSPMQK